MFSAAPRNPSISKGDATAGFLGTTVAQRRLRARNYENAPATRNAFSRSLSNSSHCHPRMVATRSQQVYRPRTVHRQSVLLKSTSKICKFALWHLFASYWRRNYRMPCFRSLYGVEDLVN